MWSAQRDIEIQEQGNNQEQQALEEQLPVEEHAPIDEQHVDQDPRGEQYCGAVVGHAEAKGQGSQQQMPGLPTFSPGQQKVEYQDDEKDVKPIHLGDDGLRPKRGHHGKGDSRHDGDQAPDRERKRGEDLPQ